MNAWNFTCAVSGKAFKAPHAPFDVGRVSDFDVSLVGDIAKRAREMGVKFKTGGYTFALDAGQMEALGLNALQSKLSRLSGGRPVNFRLFDDEAALEGMRRAAVWIPNF